MRPSHWVGRLADEQYGVVSHRQLRERGVSPEAISRWAAAGRLRQIHHGVYAVGHIAISQHGRCLAGVLAGGSGAVLSHASAAWLWGILRRWSLPVEISVPSRGHTQPGLRVHRTPALAELDRTSFEGVPVTTVPRLLLDLAQEGPRWRLEDAVEGARRRDLLDLIEIDELLRRRHRAPGTKRLREALDLYRAPIMSRAKTELRFWRAVERAGIARPSINFFVEGCELDAYWEAERFAVELDGWETHGTPRAFEADRLREEKLKLASIDVVHISARRIEREPEAVATNLARLLGLRRAELGQR